MKKFCLDLQVVGLVALNDKTVLLKLSSTTPLCECRPGQFVEVRIDSTPTVLLRRPISINYIDREKNELWLVVQVVGDGTAHLASLRVGDNVNLLMPLGNGFTLPDKVGEELLLIGGGVGAAPLLYLGSKLVEAGSKVTFLLGARSKSDLFEQEQFAAIGVVCVTTEDGSLGEKGFVTGHSVLQKSFSRIYTCGPKPMMKAVVKYAFDHAVWCEASLENKMACGLGACLCCVEKTIKGHQCVCSDGPVFNKEELLWLN